MLFRLGRGLLVIIVAGYRQRKPKSLSLGKDIFSKASRKALELNKKSSFFGTRVFPVELKRPGIEADLPHSYKSKCATWCFALSSLLSFFYNKLTQKER